MLIDTHAHLADEQFNPDREDVLRRAWEAGVAAHVEIGEHESQWAPARALSESHPGRVWWTAGFHPYYAAEADADLPRRLRAALDHERCVAVGEIGLDYHRPEVPRDKQKEVLAALLKTAAAAGKPVVLHCREAGKGSADAENDMLRILRDIFPPAPSAAPGVLHCFQGSAGFAAACRDLGFLFGVDGPVTYPNAAGLRAVLAGLPLESLVLETDSPYLPPQDRRGKRNEPSYLPAVASELARLKNAAPEEVESQTTANAERLFRTSFKLVDKGAGAV
ncbi:MAG: TatD family hydrolase [Elusimicrobiota bacterium]